MYTCRLAIQIFSADASLSAAIRAVEPQERFEHVITDHRELSETALREGDILLVDAPSPLSPEALRKACKPGAILILCADEARRAALTAAEWEALDEVWPRPFSPTAVAGAFRKTLAAVKLKKDYRLTQIYLDTTINSMPDLIWYKDVRGAHIKVNDSFCRAVGKSKQDVEGRGHYYIWDLKQEDYEKGEYVCLETEEIVLRERKTCLFDEKVKSKQGMRQFKTYKSPLFFDDGQLMGTVGVAQDVTDLANRGAELEIFLRNMPFAILISDNDDRIINVNGKFEEYFGTTAQAVTGLSYTAWKQSLDGKPMNGGTDYIEVTVKSADRARVIELHEEPILDVFQNCVGQFCICRDVTIERAFAEQILRSANTDPLTGLYNRRYLYEFVARNRKEQPLSLLYVDLDNFKQVNDAYGHKAGDETLIFMANLIREHFPDDLSVRLGGDEFVIGILGPCLLQTLEEKAMRLLRAMEENFQSSVRLLKVSASIGIAWSDDPTVELDELIRHSDSAMYRAKQVGKSRCFVYSPELPEAQASPQ